MPPIAKRSNAGALRAILRDAPRLPETGICPECGKKRYATRQGAEYVLYRCRWAEALLEKTETRAYWSRECDWWHLTSQDDDYAATAAGERNE